MRYPALALGVCALFAACSAGTPAPDAAASSAPVATATATSGPETPAPPAAGPGPQAAATIPPPPADPLAVGTQDAKDDLYCSALIYAENPDVSDALAPVDEALLRKAQALGFVIGEAGINKLVEQKAVHATHARIVADAYAAQVEKDMKAKKTRLTLAACNKRAEAVPVPE